MSIIYSHNVELSDILVNNTGNIVDSCEYSAYFTLVTGKKSNT